MNRCLTQDVVLEGCFPPLHLNSSLATFPRNSFPWRLPFWLLPNQTPYSPCPLSSTDWHYHFTPSLNFYRTLAWPFSHLQDPTLLIMRSWAHVLLSVIPLQTSEDLNIHISVEHFSYSFLASCKYNWNLDLIVPQNCSIILLDFIILLCAHTLSTLFIPLNLQFIPASQPPFLTLSLHPRGP